MKIRAGQNDKEPWNPRSVLECGGKRSATPLSDAGDAEKLRRRHALPEQSKTWRSFLAWLLFLATSTIAHAQNYSIDWHKIAGGGGTSSNGQYAVSGTLGQPDAGAMSGGNFSLTGGFWSLLAVPTPGAPLLTITLTGTNAAVVSWPSPASGFALQQNTNLNSANWITPPESITDNGTNKFIIVNPPTANRFYRLLKP